MVQTRDNVFDSRAHRLKPKATPFPELLKEITATLFEERRRDKIHDLVNRGRCAANDAQREVLEALLKENVSFVDGEVHICQLFKAIVFEQLRKVVDVDSVQHVSICSTKQNSRWFRIRKSPKVFSISLWRSCVVCAFDPRSGTPQSRLSRVRFGGSWLCACSPSSWSHLYLCHSLNHGYQEWCFDRFYTDCTEKVHILASCTN